MVKEGTDCSQVNVCYEIAYTKCEEEGDEGIIQVPTGPQARWIAGRRRGGMKKVYIGNTGKSLHGIAVQHMGGLRRGDEGNPLYKHQTEQHRDTDTPRFEMRLMTKHITNIHRLLTGGISIEKVRKLDPGALMNSKAEWGRTKFIRHTANVNIN